MNFVFAALRRRTTDQEKERNVAVTRTDTYRTGEEMDFDPRGGGCTILAPYSSTSEITTMCP
jgi:hypothetical protein